MTDSLDDGDAIARSETELPVKPDDPDALFGDYSVLSPGVQIVLDGRPVSAPPGD